MSRSNLLDPLPFRPGEHGDAVSQLSAVLHQRPEAPCHRLFEHLGRLGWHSAVAGDDPRPGQQPEVVKRRARVHLRVQGRRQAGLFGHDAFRQRRRWPGHEPVEIDHSAEGSHELAVDVVRDERLAAEHTRTVPDHGPDGNPVKLNAMDDVRTPGITALVLAGGRSTRFGSDKASAVLAGRPMLDWVVTACAEGCSPVIVARARGQVLPAVSVPTEGVEDFVEGAGPLAGLAAGLRATTTEFAFATSCDAPLLRPELIALLARELAEFDVACPEVHGRLQPLVAVYRASSTLLAAEQALAAGDSSLHALLSRLRVEVVAETDLRLADPDLDSFVNMNRPELRTAVEARLLAARREPPERLTANG